jgi:hypothetical protein
MQVSDFDIAIDDLFALKFQIELDGAMSRRMGRAHLKIHRFAGEVLRVRGHRRKVGDA